MTQQEKAGARLKQELRMKDQALQSAMSPIAIADPEGRLTYVNPAFLDLWGCEAEQEVLGRKVVEFWETGDQAAQVVEALQERGHWRGELTARRADGTLVAVQVAANSVADDNGQPVGMTASFQDISKRKEAQRNAEHAREQLRTIIDSLPALVSYVDADYRYVFVSKGYEEVFERERGDIVGRTPPDVIGEEAFQAVKPDIDRALAGERVEYEREMPYATGTRWTQTTFVPDVAEDGSVRGMVALVHDISRRKRTEEGLAEEKAFSEALISSLPGVFYLFDAEGRFVRWNQNFADVSGYSDEELAEMTPPDFFQGDDQDRVAESVQRVFAEGQATVEADFVTKSGQTVPYLFTGVLMELQGDPYLGGIGVDISERKAVEEDLQYHREHLEDLVEARTETIQRQTEEILELSTPVLNLTDSIVAVPLIGTLDSRRAAHFTDVLLHQIAASDAAVALVDITGVPTVDTQTARHLIKAIAAARLLGARVVLTGVRPSIAQSLIHLGIDLSDLTTRASLSAGVRVAEEMIA